jgi:hypothetical protein
VPAKAALFREITADRRADAISPGNRIVSPIAHRPFSPDNRIFTDCASILFHGQLDQSVPPTAASTPFSREPRLFADCASTPFSPGKRIFPPIVRRPLFDRANGLTFPTAASNIFAGHGSTDTILADCGTFEQCPTAEACSKLRSIDITLGL